jgi:hypothetical protein
MTGSILVEIGTSNARQRFVGGLNTEQGQQRFRVLLFTRSHPGQNLSHGCDRDIQRLTGKQNILDKGGSGGVAVKMVDLNVGVNHHRA